MCSCVCFWTSIIHCCSWTHKNGYCRAYWYWSKNMHRIVFHYDSLARGAQITHRMLIMCIFFPPIVALSHPLSLLSCLSYWSLHGTHSFSNYILAIILGWHFGTVNHAHFCHHTQVKVCEWGQGKHETGREGERDNLQGWNYMWIMHCCQDVCCQHPLGCTCVFVCLW